MRINLSAVSHQQFKNICVQINICQTSVSCIEFERHKRFYYKNFLFLWNAKSYSARDYPSWGRGNYWIPHFPFSLGPKLTCPKIKKRSFMNLAFLSAYPGCSLHKYLVKVLEFISLRLQCIPLNAKLLQTDVWMLSYILKKAIT